MNEPAATADDSPLVSSVQTDLISNQMIESIDLEEPSLPTSTKEIADELDPSKVPEEKDSLVVINGFRFKEGRLQLRLKYTSDDTQWVDF